jgi:Domain of unknown function (DUF4432)
MSALSPTLQCWTLRCSNRNLATSKGIDNRSELAELPDRIRAGDGQFSMQYRRLSGGRSEGMACLTIDTGSVTTDILPDRGMGIWKCWAGDLECGWQSPVQGPVHPQWVSVHDPNGIGWLEGFDELLVRCGLHNNGAPDFDEKGALKFPLHGRIANLPAHQLDVQVDIENGILDVVGKVREARFLIYSLELETRYRFRVGSPEIEVIDTVTNRSGVAGSMQMLYHINVGQPILQSGSKIHAAYRRLTPRDARAKQGTHAWDQCHGPDSNYAEQVYFLSPYADQLQWTESMLESADGTCGFAVHFDTRTLPFLNIWKNTMAVEDGYVVGIEPATGYPNPRSTEEKGGRVVALQAGESITFRLKLQPLASAKEVAHSRHRIQSLQTNPGEIVDEPFNR